MQYLECTRCHKNLSLDSFSLKNVKDKIYYLHCDTCREKIKNFENKKQNEKDNYDLVKKTNVIHCNCGTNYVSFRTYHYIRHINSKKHKLGIMKH